jgi:hypothetical protein
METDCPLVDPENPENRLTGGWPEFGNFATHFVRRGDVWHSTEILGQPIDRDTTFNCQYHGPQGRGRNIVLAVPGLMLRCDWLARDVLKPQPVEPGTGGPIEHVFLRIWCTSRP